MTLSLRSGSSRLAGAATAIWLCGAGSAWAGGGGGEDLAGLNKYLEDTLCPLLSVSPAFCPQLPTLTQGFLEIAALLTGPPEMVRATQNIALGNHPDADNPSRPPALNPITAFPVIDTPKNPALSNLLPTLAPLAFVSASNTKNPAAVRQPYDPAVDTFFYAVASGPNVQPDRLFFFYDNLSSEGKAFKNGQLVAKISLPLTVLSQDGVTERTVAATLQVIAPTADCSVSTVSGDFMTPGVVQTGINPAQLGVNCAAVFASSPGSMDKHSIVEVEVPLVVTNATDPLYFPGGNVLANFASPFKTDEPGFIPTGPNSPLPSGASIGISPSAEANAIPGDYPLCANLLKNGNGKALAAAVAAFYAISTDGEMLLSAPIAPLNPIQCPRM